MFFDVIWIANSTVLLCSGDDGIVQMRSKYISQVDEGIIPQIPFKYL